MNSEPLCNLLEDYVDDDLSSDLKFQFESHLDSCLNCQTRLQEMRELDSLLTQAWKHVDLGSRQTTSRVARPLPPQSGDNNSWLWISTISALAAVLLLAIGVASLLTKPAPELAGTNSNSPTTKIAEHSPQPQLETVDDSPINPGYQTSYATASFDAATKGSKVETNKEFTVYRVVPKVTFSKTN